MTRGSLVALAWCDFQARTQALASELGGEAWFISGGWLRRHRGFLPIRYLRDALMTWRVLRRRNPAAVIVISPPVFAPLVAWAWCRLHRRKLVVDCHTAAFHSRKWGWALPLHRWLLRRADAVSLHTHPMLEEASSWNNSAFLLPDDLPDPSLARKLPSGNRPRVLVAGSFDANEPIGLVLQAAALLPAVEFRLTGDLHRISPEVRGSAPANVVYTGWIAYPDFLGEVQAADVVAAFSTDPEIMNRAAFEAVAFSRPLVLSDLPGLRSRFGAAARFSANEPRAMAAAVDGALQDCQELAERSRLLQDRLRQERQAGMTRLESVLLGDDLRTRPSQVLLLSQHPYPTHPLLRRNVEHLLGQGVQLDLVCTRPAVASGLDHKTLPALLRVHALPVKHRRWSALAYPLEYLAFFLLALPVVCWLGLRKRYDVVQVDNLPDFLAFTAFLPRLRGARIVLYIYDLFPEMTMTRLHASPRHPLVRMARGLESLTIRWVDHVITVSEYFRGLLVGRGVDPDKVSILPNTQPMPSGMTWKRPPSPVLITHASIVQRYGVQVAIGALPHLLQAWPEIRLEVLGQGEYLPTLKQLAQTLGVVERVSFRGFVPWGDAMERIAKSSLGVVPVVADGFGELILPMKLLEYVAIGIPVVCARLPGIMERFPENTLAFFPQGDSKALAAQVDRLLRDPEEAEQQASRARQALESIRWENVSSRYLTALQPSG